MKYFSLARYGRITSGGALIPEIDGLRFIAILFVYIYHLTGDVIRHSPAETNYASGSRWLFPLTQVLGIGVPMFFTISGFILGLPFAKQHLPGGRPVNLAKYFFRRLTRLEPPYIMALLVFFAIKIVGNRGNFFGLFPNLLASIFYVHNITFGRPSDINFVAWSLEVEIQFYIIAPMLAAVFAIRRPIWRRLVLTWAVLITAFGSQLIPRHSPLQLSILAYIQYFLTGFLLVDIYVSWRELTNTVIWDFVFLAAIASIPVILIRGQSQLLWIVPWMILFVYISAFRGIFVKTLVGNLWVSTIGGMCYSIYLIHNYTIAALGGFTEHLGQEGAFGTRILLQFVLMTPFVLILSAAYFRIIERPCMVPDWPRRLQASLAILKGTISTKS